MTSIKEISLSDKIKNNLKNYTKLTSVQSQSIPVINEGHDLLAIAQTGTGKTAAFCLPIINSALNRINEANRKPMALILTPTRELASQINEKIKTYAANTDVKTEVIIGGVRKEGQIEALKSSIDIIVSTPGRLLDLISGSHIDLKSVKFFVLDEADMMLDMGFSEDVNLIFKSLPSVKQNLLFSATMPKQIEELASKILNNPKKIEVDTQSSVKDSIDQSIYFVDEDYKLDLLTTFLLDSSMARVMVFCKAKYSVASVVEHLNNQGISNSEIHSNITQTQRNEAISNFTNGQSRVLVATDIASRGIDISDVTHVINYNLPEDATYYVHRIGRTARASKGGVAISMCGHRDIALLRNIQKLIRKDIKQILDHPFHKEFDLARLHVNKTKNRKRPSQAKRRAKDKFIENLKK